MSMVLEPLGVPEFGRESREFKLDHLDEFIKKYSQINNL